MADAMYAYSIDGSNDTLLSRERPQVFVDERTHEPVALFTGALGGAYGNGTVKEAHWYSYTHAQRINSAAAASARAHK